MSMKMIVVSVISKILEPKQRRMFSVDRKIYYTIHSALCFFISGPSLRSATALERIVSDGEMNSPARFSSIG